MNVTNSLDEVTTIGPNLRRFLSDLLSEGLKATEDLHDHTKILTSRKRDFCELAVDRADELEYALYRDDQLEKLDPQLG